jgi:glucose/arabinose dehydrogenase
MFWISFAAAVALYLTYGSGSPDPDRLRLPPGFHVAEFGHVPGARSMALGANGTVFVGSQGQGSVTALVDLDGDGVADETHVIASDLRTPNGVAYADGSLFVAELHRIVRYDDIERRLEDPPTPVVILDGLPTERLHGWKYLRFGPDGWLYFQIGAPCNICLSTDDRFATILRVRPDGTDLEVFARGVRNSVGFDWHPETEVLWFTDNGRDRLGDDVPPDELNRAPEPGLHFGYPFCHGGMVPDPEYGAARPCSDFIPPALQLGAHVAPLGLRFYTGTMFPEAYRGRLFVAQHGSWNRSEPDGYRVIVVDVRDGAVVSSEVFIEGWLVDGRAWGRPVDVAVTTDGALLISDDRGGVIYRVTYED